MKDQNERDERVKEIEAEIADIKRRLPAHSVKPAMISQLEELEEELEQLKKEN
ncbi:MAG TPA: histidine kinase [Desulfotomaculum sp.]|nr:MAG: histidine kinase [Desulfotomaculum sp. BICA1-6]HBX24076.1 histidine kinase [Desulfotomaculum sp.]